MKEAKGQKPMNRSAATARQQRAMACIGGVLAGVLGTYLLVNTSLEYRAGATTIQATTQMAQTLKTAKELGFQPKNRIVREVDSVCVAACDPNTGYDDFNYAGSARIIILTGGQGYYKVAYKANGEKLWECAGNSEEQVFARMENGKPIRVQIVYRLHKGWHIGSTFENKADAEAVWAAATQRFLSIRPSPSGVYEVQLSSH